jgi:hypothetical protein
VRRASVIPLVATSLLLLAGASGAQVALPHESTVLAANQRDTTSLDKTLDSINTAFDNPRPTWDYQDGSVTLIASAFWTISERKGCSVSFVRDHVLIGDNLDTGSHWTDHDQTTVVVPLDQIEKVHVDKSTGILFGTNGESNPTFPEVVLDGNQGGIPVRITRSAFENGKSMPVKEPESSRSDASASFEFAHQWAAEEAAKAFQHAVALCRISATKSPRTK